MAGYETPKVNDFSHLSDTGVAVWIEAELSGGDGLLSEICPSAFELGIDGIAHTRFGHFLGSTAAKGMDGLRPVTTPELASVVEALQEDVNQSGRIITEGINPEKLWPQFLGKSAVDMIKTTEWSLGVLTPEPEHEVFEDFLAGHLLSLATILDSEPSSITGYTYEPRGELLIAIPTEDIIARIDLFELLDLDAAYTEADRDDIVSTLRYLAENIEDHALIEKWAGKALTPLFEIRDRLDTLVSAA